MQWIKLLSLISLFLTPRISVAQDFPSTLSDKAEIYLVTCGPGNEIWSHFGHSAIRVVDPAYSMDIAFNYGMFNYSDPNFTWKFAKRTMQYYLAVTDFQNFVQLYVQEGRYVYQQKILVDGKSAQSMYEALVDNYEDETKKFYLYEFFYDNCATRPRDMIEFVGDIGVKNQWGTHPDAEEHTFRELIDKGFESTPWVDFGIDIVLGSRLDVPVTNRELMFLPEYLAEIGAKTEINGAPLLGPKEYVFEAEPLTAEAGWLTPSLVFWALFILVFAISVFTHNSAWLKHLDAFIFLLFGALGIFVLFMWFGTDHQGTKANYNILWTHPIHLVSIAFLYVRNLTKKYGKYLLVMAYSLLGFFLIFWLLPQSFHPAVKPIVLLMAYRYYALYRLNQRNLLFKTR